MGHWRTRDGDEVDLVVERDDGAIVAFAAGEAFLAGVALHLGERSYTYEDRLHVMPVDRLWVS